MGWKSTIDITKREAIDAIMQVLYQTMNKTSTMSFQELENIMYGLGIGDDTDKPYYGHNFNITD